MRADGGRTYRIGFAANCNSADSYSLVLHPVGNGNQVCRAIGLDVHVRGTGEACTPDSLTRLSPRGGRRVAGEAQALRLLSARP